MIFWSKIVVFHMSTFNIDNQRQILHNNFTLIYRFRSVFFLLICESRGMLPLFLRGLLGPNPVYSMGVGQGTPWMSRQLIAGPLLMAVAASQGANCTGAALGFSILLKDTLACSSVPPRGASDH